MQKDYIQPDFYHFSTDSVFLAKYAAGFANDAFKEENLLASDWGAGCGVIGFEFLRRAVRKWRLRFVEKNALFIPYLEKNCEWVKSSNKDFPEIVISQECFLESKVQTQYSLILSNPPYFFTHEGRLSRDVHRSSARSWKEEDFRLFLQKIHLSLNPQGFCLFLSPSERKNIIILENEKIKLIDEVFIDERKSLFIVQSLDKQG